MKVSFQIPEFETERLRLRLPKLADFDLLSGFRASPRASFVGGPYSREDSFVQLAAMIGHWQLRGYGRWMVAERETDTPVGVVGLYFPEGWPEPEIAWSVFDGQEGKGYAFEAAMASRAYAYDELGWSGVISMIDPANTRSVALAKRMGARPDGQFVHETFGPMHVWRHLSPAEVAA